MSNKKVAELDAEFIEYKAKAKARMDALEKKFDDGIGKLDASIKAMKEEYDAKFEELKRLILGTALSRSTQVDHVPQITKVATKTTPCVPPIRRGYDDFGCLPLPKNKTDFKEDEDVSKNTRSDPKEDKDEQGPEEKGVVNFFEVGTDEENNSDGELNNVGRIVCGRGEGTWADVGLKHGSYLLLARRLEDDWYLFVEFRSSKEPHCKYILDVHLQFHVNRQDTCSQGKMWDPGITIFRSDTLRTRCFLGAGVMIRTLRGGE